MQEFRNELTGDVEQKFYQAATELQLEEKMVEDLRAMQSTGHTLTRTVKKIGRNDPCPCGSGKKFKRCHIDEVK